MKESVAGSVVVIVPPGAHDAAFHHLLISSPPLDHPRDPSDHRDRPRRNQLVNTTHQSAPARRPATRSAEPILLCILYRDPSLFSVSIFSPFLSPAPSFLSSPADPRLSTRNFALEHPRHARDILRYGIVLLVQKCCLTCSTSSARPGSAHCMHGRTLADADGSLFSLLFPHFPVPSGLIIRTLVLNPPPLAHIRLNHSEHLLCEPIVPSRTVTYA